MKRTFFVILIIVSLCYSLRAQSVTPQVKVNAEMIARLNQCELTSDYLSWRDLVTGFDSQSLANLYAAYLSVDFSKQTLSDIKLELLNRMEEYLKTSNICREDLAWYNQVKREINNKLVLSEVTALK